MSANESSAASARDETLSMFRAAGALLEGDHFVYVSGEHGDGWVAKDLLFPDTAVPARLGVLLAEQIALAGWAPAVVCGPATGGLIMSQWVAHALGARSVFTEHDPAVAVAGRGEGAVMASPFMLRRGFGDDLAGVATLAVDDIVNTGHSLRETIRALRDCGADVIAAATWVTRGNVDAASLGVDRFVALAEVPIPSWPAAACHLCQDGVPINVRYAHGAEYVAHRAGPTTP